MIDEHTTTAIGKTEEVISGRQGDQFGRGHMVTLDGERIQVRNLSRVPVETGSFVMATLGKIDDARQWFITAVDMPETKADITFLGAHEA